MPQLGAVIASSGGYGRFHHVRRRRRRRWVIGRLAVPSWTYLKGLTRVLLLALTGFSSTSSDLTGV